MKSLNKKISSILLAGMVVMGGVLSSGVSSFAASAKNVSVQGNPQYNRIKFYIQEYGEIIGMSKKGNDFEGKYNNGKCYNNGKFVKVKYPSQIPKHLVNAKYSKKEFVKIEFDGFYYLIKVK